MARQALTGSRVRDRRVLMGLKQAELARAVGVSPAYLNLIEHNRRRVSGALLGSLAAVLKVDAAVLAEGGEGALFVALRDAAAVAEPGVAPELAAIEDFVSRFPGWSALLATRHDQAERLARTVETLSERMAQDPFLAASLHEVLSAITSIRSTSAILAEDEGIDPEWQGRFHRNIHDDSVRLSNVSAALVAWLDQAQSPESGLASPQEEFESWLQARGWHVPELERGPAPEPERLIARAPQLASAAARQLAVAYLQAARADAQALPLQPFLAALAAAGADPFVLARRFAISPSAVMRRIAALPEGAAPPGLGLVVCDATGTLTFRRAAPGFVLPRFGAACALWPLFEALGQPVTPIVRSLRTAGRGAGARFAAYVWCERSFPAGYGGPQVAASTMLLLPHGGPEAPDERVVGVSCRICPEAACVARREPSILL